MRLAHKLPLPQSAAADDRSNLSHWKPKLLRFARNDTDVTSRSSLPGEILNRCMVGYSPQRMSPPLDE